MSDEDQQVSGVNWGWFAILASIIAIVGVTTYFLLPSLISKTVTDITVVKAIDAPIKVKPLDPGGEAVDHQDLLVVALDSTRPMNLNVKYLCLVMLVVVLQIVLVDQQVLIGMILNLA